MANTGSPHNFWGWGGEDLGFFFKCKIFQTFGRQSHLMGEKDCLFVIVFRDPFRHPILLSRALSRKMHPILSLAAMESLAFSLGPRLSSIRCFYLKGQWWIMKSLW